MVRTRRKRISSLGLRSTTVWRRSAAAALDQHERAQSGGVHLPGAAEVDDQPPGPFGHAPPAAGSPPCGSRLGIPTRVYRARTSRAPPPAGSSSILLRHRAISPSSGETSSFAAPDHSGCALIGRIDASPDGSVAAVPKGKASPMPGVVTERSNITYNGPSPRECDRLRCTPRDSTANDGVAIDGERRKGRTAKRGMVTQGAKRPGPLAPLIPRSSARDEIRPVRPSAKTGSARPAPPRDWAGDRRRPWPSARSWSSG